MYLYFIYYLYVHCSMFICRPIFLYLYLQLNIYTYIYDSVYTVIYRSISRAESKPKTLDNWRYLFQHQGVHAVYFTSLRSTVPALHTSTSDLSITLIVAMALFSYAMIDMVGWDRFRKMIITYEEIDSEGGEKIRQREKKRGVKKGEQKSNQPGEPPRRSWSHRSQQFSQVRNLCGTS